MATKIYNKEGGVEFVKATRLQAYLDAGWSVTPIQVEAEVKAEVEVIKEAPKEKKKGKK